MASAWSVLRDLALAVGERERERRAAAPPEPEPEELEAYEGASVAYVPPRCAEALDTALHEASHAVIASVVFGRESVERAAITLDAEDGAPLGHVQHVIPLVVHFRGRAVATPRVELGCAVVALAGTSAERRFAVGWVERDPDEPDLIAARAALGRMGFPTRQIDSVIWSLELSVQRLIAVPTVERAIDELGRRLLAEHRVGGDAVRAIVDRFGAQRAANPHLRAMFRETFAALERGW